MKLAYILALCVLAAASPAAAKHRAHTHRTHARFDPREFIIFLKGSPRKLALENRRMDSAHRPRFTERTLEEAKRQHAVVRIPENHPLVIDRNLPPKYRYCRPETVTFLLNLSGAYRTTFGKNLKLTSCVRTVERQEYLKKVNGNAARGGRPDRRSLHLTGYAADITKLGMTSDEVRWMRAFLVSQARKGRADTTEEWVHPCFHVVVNPVHADRPHRSRRHGSRAA